MDAPVWTRRQRMGFPRADAGVHYCLPLFLHQDDCRSFWLTTSDGRQMACCKDPVHEGVDHELLWLDRGPHESVFFFCEPDANLFTRRDAGRAPEEIEALRRLEVQEPEAVLPLADFFRGGAEAVLERWELRAESDQAASDVTTRPLQEMAAMGFPACGATGELLDLDPSHGFVGLVRQGRQSAYGTNGSTIVRVHFFDDGENHSALGHWLGFKSWRGTAAIGLAFGIDGCYSTLSGRVPTGKQGEHFGWMRTAVDRTRGWHTFEMLFEAGQVHFSIDSEPVASTAAEGTSSTEEVSLVSRCGGHGLWAGVEVFHVPRGQQTWEVGVQNLKRGDRIPWTALTEIGRWQVDDKGVMQNVCFMEGAVAEVTAVRQQLIDSFALVPEKYQYSPQMDCMLGRQFRVMTVNSDGMVGLPSPQGSAEPVWWFPPVAAALIVATELSSELLGPAAPEAPEAPQSPAPAPEFPAQAVAREEQEESPAEEPTPREARPGVGGLAIECWSRPGEADLERMERVMTTFVEALEAANVALPGNIHRIEQCRASQHASCFVYSFGTRRLHVATRATESGRLLLVVRCGGGFIDFIEFARRHGSLESMRVERNNQLRASGGGVVRLTSVLSRGKLRVQQGRSSVVSRQGSRPPSRASSQQANSPSSGSRSPDHRAAGA